MPLEEQRRSFIPDNQSMIPNQDAIIKKLRKVDDAIGKGMPYIGAALCTTAGIWALSGIVYRTRKSGSLRSYLKRTDAVSKFCQSAIGATAIAEILYPNSIKDLEKFKGCLKKFVDVQ